MTPNKIGFVAMAMWELRLHGQVQQAKKSYWGYVRQKETVFNTSAEMGDTKVLLRKKKKSENEAWVDRH